MDKRWSYRNRKKQIISNQCPRTGHFAVSPSSSRGIISIDDSHLPAFIGLAERVAALFPHALYLSHFTDRLLELLHARPVVLHVVLLDLLHVVVVLRVVHPLGVFPGVIAEKANAGQDDGHQVEDG